MMTQKELAAAIGESYNILQPWTNRNRLPNALRREKIIKLNHAKTIKLLKDAIQT